MRKVWRRHLKRPVRRVLDVACGDSPHGTCAGARGNCGRRYRPLADDDRGGTQSGGRRADSLLPPIDRALSHSGASVRRRLLHVRDVSDHDGQPRAAFPSGLGRAVARTRRALLRRYRSPRRRRGSRRAQALAPAQSRRRRHRGWTCASIIVRSHGLRGCTRFTSWNARSIFPPVRWSRATSCRCATRCRACWSLPRALADTSRWWRATPTFRSRSRSKNVTDAGSACCAACSFGCVGFRTRSRF